MKEKFIKKPSLTAINHWWQLKNGLEDLKYVFYHSLINILLCAGILEQSMGARNRAGTQLPHRPASLYSLAGRYDNPIPTRFL
jgi:hypothetical protein